MNWLLASFLAFFCWGGYAIFGNKATTVHGPNVSMMFEAVSMMLVALVVAHSSRQEFANITWKSGVYGFIMGLLSAIGFLFLLMAMKAAPQNISLITLITGSYAVVTISAIALTRQLKPEWISEAAPLTSVQGIGMVVVILGLVLLNWDSSWNSQLKILLGFVSSTS